METIRISAATVARIDLDGKLLVGLNKSRLRAGKKVYTPFGGALEFYGPARAFLQDIGAVFEKGNDLRLEIPERSLTRFTDWFYQRIARETSPFRELKEELVYEEGLLPSLQETDVQLRYLRTFLEREVTDKPGIEGKLTQRFIEVYEAKFNHEYEQMFRTALAQQETHLALLTEEEIRSKISKTGIKAQCDSLID